MKAPSGCVLSLASVPGVGLGKALVTPFVVPCHACHELLRLRRGQACHFGQELFRVVGTQSRRQSAVMEDLNRTVLAASVAEPKVFRHHGTRQEIAADR